MGIIVKLYNQETVKLYNQDIHHHSSVPRITCTTMHPSLKRAVQPLFASPDLFPATQRNQSVKSLKERAGKPKWSREIGATNSAASRIEVVKKPTTQTTSSDVEQNYNARVGIATHSLSYLFEEIEPEVKEELLEILTLLHKGKLNLAASRFRGLTASHSRLLIQFQHHLRSLDSESIEEDGIEFGADLSKTKKAILALVYERKNSQGKPNTYFSDEEIDAWFEDMELCLAEDEETVL